MNIAKAKMNFMLGDSERIKDIKVTKSISN